MTQIFKPVKGFYLFIVLLLFYQELHPGRDQANGVQRVTPPAEVSLSKTKPEIFAAFMWGGFMANIGTHVRERFPCFQQLSSFAAAESCPASFSPPQSVCDHTKLTVTEEENWRFTQTLQARF